MLSPTVKSQMFRQMHHDSSLLVLPNAWDAISARILEEAGFRAIATTSVGIAVAAGYRDGHTPCDEMVRGVAHVARAVSVPVTADIESGYGRTVQEIVNNVARFLDVGVIGINLEDSLSPTEPLVSLPQQVETIHAIREMGTARGLPLVINARTDVISRGDRPRHQLLEETFQRAQAYLSAGADCIYVFGDHDRDMIAELVQGIQGPINILATPLTPPLAELELLGVARISFGGGFIEATMGLVRDLADTLSRGGYPHFPTSLSYQDLNGYFPRG